MASVDFMIRKISKYRLIGKAPVILPPLVRIVHQ
jgi:hypothetical protein